MGSYLQHVSLCFLGVRGFKLLSGFLVFMLFKEMEGIFFYDFMYSVKYYQRGNWLYITLGAQLIKSKLASLYSLINYSYK
jgi:hypothetical protein